MVTFANLGSVRLPSLKFVGLRVRKIRRIQCVSCLSTTVSQLFGPQLQTNRHFYVPRPSFFVCPGDAPAAITQNVARMKRQFSACQIPRSMYPSILNSFPVIRTASANNRRFHVPQPHFCFSWRRPCDYHAMCCMDGKTIQCLPNPSQHVPIHLQQFPSYTMLKSMRKSKNRYFYHILISPGDAPGAITLNVVWMEREFNAYKLSCCMCPSNYNRL